MKNQTKLIFLALVTIACLTEYMRSGSVGSLVETQRNLALTTYLTSTTRTQNVANFCTKSRTNLVSSTDRSTNTQYFANMKTYLPVSASALIGAAARMDIATLQTQAQSMGVGLGIFVVPFVLGLILSIILWPFLCCCCTCPSCCPSKCCQKQDQILYTKCELLWPAVFLMLVLLLACAASVPGITRATILSDSIQTAQCGISIVLDDILNGNISADGTTFWTGLNTMNNDLGTLQSDVNNTIDILYNNLNSISSSISTDAQNIMNSVAILTNPNTANDTYSINYTNTPIPNYSSVNSTFGYVLGVPSNSSTLQGALYTIAQTIYTNMSSVNTAVNNLNTTKASINAGLSTAISSVSSFVGTVSSADTNVGNFMSMGTPYLNYIKLGSLAFFGAVIGMSVIALLGVVTMACFDKVGCRHLMYGACVFLWLICILGFIISFMLSIIVPFMYMGCTYINYGLSNSVNFQNLTSTLSLDASFSNYISVCLSDQNGRILSALGSNGIDTQMSQIQNTMANALTYSNFNTTALTAAYNNISTVVTNYQNNVLIDMPDQSYFQKLSNGSYYSSSCAANDYFIPNQNATNFSCNGKTFAACASGFATSCPASSCIDLYQVFNYYLTNSIDPSANLTSRYGSASGCTIAADLESLYTNWFTVKNTIGSTSQSIASINSRLSGNINANITDISTNVTTINSNFSNAYTEVNAAMSNITDPTYGMLAGINCKVIGEDLVLMKDTLCVTMFNSFYFLFITIGTASFGILFSLCCIVCSGVRHYKQDEKKNGQKVLNDRSFNEKK